MGHNSQKNPYANRTNFLYKGASFCNSVFSGAVRGCQKSAKFFIQKSYDYNKRFQTFVGKNWQRVKKKKKH